MDCVESYMNGHVAIYCFSGDWNGIKSILFYINKTNIETAVTIDSTLYCNIQTYCLYGFNDLIKIRLNELSA